MARNHPGDYTEGFLGRELYEKVYELRDTVMPTPVKMTPEIGSAVDLLKEIEAVSGTVRAGHRKAETAAAAIREHRRQQHELGEIRDVSPPAFSPYPQLVKTGPEAEADPNSPISKLLGQRDALRTASLGPTDDDRRALAAAERETRRGPGAPRLAQDAARSVEHGRHPQAVQAHGVRRQRGAGRHHPV
jgi:hypothetical protein